MPEYVYDSLWVRVGKSTTKNKFPYVDKWLLDNQIDHKLCNQLWKAKSVIEAQITQTLKLIYAQYMRNHKKYILAPHIPKPQMHPVPS